MIKKLIKSVREYKSASIATPIFVSLEVVMECIIPLIIAKLLNIMYTNDVKKIITYGLLVILTAVASLTFAILAGRSCATASCGFAKNLRKDLYYKVQHFSFTNIDRFTSSSLVTRLTTDVTNVQQSYMMIIRIAVRSPLMFIISMAMSFSISVKMSLIFLAVAPLLAVGLAFIIIKTYPVFEKAFKKYDKLNASVQENVKGIRVVKTFVREEHESKKFNNAAEDLRTSFTKGEKQVAMISPLMEFCMYTGMVLVCALGALLIIKTFGGFDAQGNPVWGELSTGELSSLMTYAIQILSSLMMLSMVLVMITLSMASAKRICEVLDEPINITDKTDALTEIKSGDVRFDNVSFKYSPKAERYALSDVNIDIKSGETIGVLGGTGSGKSSLVQLITRLYDVTDGNLYVGGVDVRDYDIDSLRNQVSVVLQKNVLFSGTVAENLRWGNPDATDEQLNEACALACADEFINALPDGYNTYVEQGGTNFSGGQKQRLCIARALLKKPKILILDDSTSAVDMKTDAKIRSALKKTIPSVTKIIIAQRIASVIDADKIIVLENGKVDGIGTHEQLLENNNIYQEVYYSQNGKGGND